MASRDSATITTSSLTKILSFWRSNTFGSISGALFRPSSLKFIWAISRTKDTSRPYYIIRKNSNIDAEKSFDSYIEEFCRQKEDRQWQESHWGSLPFWKLLEEHEIKLRMQYPNQIERVHHLLLEPQSFISLQWCHVIVNCRKYNAIQIHLFRRQNLPM